MKNINFIFLNLMCLTLLITGCGKASTNETSADKEAVSVVSSSLVNRADDGRIIVGISMPDQQLERWNRDGAFLKSEFEKYGYEVILSYADNLIDKQIRELRNMIDEGVDLVVVSAIDGGTLTSVLDEASQAGVKVIAYDRLLMDTDMVDYYVSFDNYIVGELQARYVIDALKLDDSDETRNIEIVTGDPVDNNARYFYNGEMDTLAPYFEKGKLNIVSGQKDFYVTATGTWSTEIAQQRMQIILNSYYKHNRLDAVVCANDSTALGAVNAIKSDYSQNNKVIVTGQDADVENVYNILSGNQSMTVFKALKNEAIVTVDLTRAVLEGGSPDEKLIEESGWDFECRYDTTSYNNGRKNVKSYLLIPKVLDSSNIKKELFDTGYYTYDSDGNIVPGE